VALSRSSERRALKQRVKSVLALSFAALLWEAAPAHADLYRCIGPDGGLVFTDNESICPGAATYEPSGALQTHRSEAPPSHAADSPWVKRRPNLSPANEQTAMRHHWQEKKIVKERELRVLEERSEYLSRFVTGCNRGAVVVGRDETGIKRTVSCDKIRAEYQQNLERQQPIREYLDSGLQRECRRAGCLPGWIR